MLFPKNITLLKYQPGNRREWLRLRKKVSGQADPSVCRFGGSDIGYICGVSEYKSAAAVYYERIGLKTDTIKTNPHMYRGTITEGVIVDYYWRFYDPEKPDMDTLIDNQVNNKIIRKARRVNAIILNDKYPQLFANVDRIVPPQLGKKRLILEIKNSLSVALDKWKRGFPESYLYQVQQYMLVTGIKNAELFILRDSTYPICFEIEASKEIQDEIEYRSLDMARRVLTARSELWSKAYTEAEMREIAEQYEPEPETTPAYVDFLKDWWKPENQIMNEKDGDEDLLREVLSYLLVREEKKRIEDIALQSEIKIRNAFRKNGNRRFKFPYGTISWNKNLSIPNKILEKAKEDGYIN